MTAPLFPEYDELLRDIDSADKDQGDVDGRHDASEIE